MLGLKEVVWQAGHITSWLKPFLMSINVVDVGQYVLYTTKYEYQP